MSKRYHSPGIAKADCEGVAGSSAVIRQAVFEDAEGIHAVQLRNGLAGLDLDFWEQNCFHHPFRSEYSDAGPGWVIEGKTGRIVGSLINILLPIEWKGRLFRAVASGAWAVDAEHRSLLALGLLGEWFRQPQAEMWIVGSANDIASQIMPKFGMERIPMDHHSDGLFWVLDSRKFVAAAARKKAIPGSGVLAIPGGLALSGYAMIAGHGRGRCRGPVETISAFDERFDAFWQKLRADVPRVRAVRTQAMLEWRFASSLIRKEVTILTAQRGGDMKGYAVLVSQPRSHLRLEQNVICDLQALGDAPDVLDDLLGAAIRISRQQGKHALEWRGYHASKRASAMRRRPFHYLYPGWPLYYRSRERSFQETLRSSEAWDFSPFDTF